MLTWVRVPNSLYHSREHEVLPRYWFNVGLASQTVGQQRAKSDERLMFAIMISDPTHNTLNVG